MHEIILEGTYVGGGLGLGGPETPRLLFDLSKAFRVYEEAAEELLLFPPNYGISLNVSTEGVSWGALGPPE